MLLSDFTVVCWKLAAERAGRTYEDWLGDVLRLVAKGRR